MLHGQRRPTFLNTIHCILERVDLLEVEAVSIIEEHRLETRSEDADRTRADRSREPTFFNRRARSARRMLVRSHRSTERVRDTLFSAARIPVSTDDMSATRVPPSPQARRSSYINSWVFALRKATLLPFLGCRARKRCVAVTPEGGTTAVRQGAGDVPRDPGNWERFRVELVDILP